MDYWEEAGVEPSRNGRCWYYVYMFPLQGENKYSNLVTFERNWTCVSHNQRIYLDGRMNSLPSGNRGWIFYMFSFCNSRDTSLCMFPTVYGSFRGEAESCLHCGVAQCVIEDSEFCSNSNYFSSSNLSYNGVTMFVQLLFSLSFTLFLSLSSLELGQKAVINTISNMCAPFVFCSTGDRTYWGKEQE